MQRREFVKTVGILSAMPIFGFGLNKPEPKLFCNGECTILAESIEQAESWYMKECGITKKEAEGEGWHEYKPHETISCKFDEYDYETKTKTAKEWIQWCLRDSENRQYPNFFSFDAHYC